MIEIYKSDNNIVGFIKEAKQDGWQINALKFIFSQDTGDGIYMMGNKTPVTAQFSINKFGFLEIKLGLKYDRTITFARME